MKIFNNTYVKVLFSVAILMLFVVTSQRAFLQSLKGVNSQLDTKNVEQRGGPDQFDSVIYNDFTKGRRMNVKSAPVAANRPSAIGTDLGSESEPNDTEATADVLTGTDGKIKGSLFSGTTAPAATDPDVYAITTTVAASKLYAAVINSPASQQDSVMEIRGPGIGGPLLETDDQDGSFGGSSSSVAGTVLPTVGTYYIRITNFSVTAPIAPYDLYFAIRSGATTVETEPNNNGTPQALPASQYVNGAIDPVADTDTFSFTANAGDTVFLSQDLDPERDTTTFNGRIGIGLVGTPPNFLVSSDAGTFDTIDSEAIVLTVKTTGTYQVYVDSQVAGGGGPTATYAFNVTTIPAAAAGTCTTYTNAVSTPIADLALTTSTISIPDSKIIRSLRVVTDITHANYPDLDVHLRSPSNNDNGLYTDVGVATQTGAQNTRMDDEAALPILFTVLNGVIWKPEPAYRLNWFNGENSLGTWALDIRDDLTANAGTLNSWSLEVCEEPAPLGNLIYNQDFEANNGGYTSSGTANEWEYGTPATPAQTVTSPFIAPFAGCASGTSCWKTDLDNTYDFSSSQDLTSPNLNLTNYAGTIRLFWQQRYQMESISFDRIWVRVTEVGNPANTRMVWHADNQSMGETVGSGASVANIPESAGWGRYNADISDFAGKNIQVTFHLESDVSVNYGGWAIDDVQLRHSGVVAASVPVGGRVLDSSGFGVSKARVTLTGSNNGGTRTVITNGFGYYRFDDVEVGQNYIFEVNSKRHAYTPQVIFVTEEIEDLNFTAAP